MDHKEVEEGNIIDLYLRLELTTDKEVAFEEHLLGCSMCRENLRVAESVKAAVEAGKTEEFRKSELTLTGKKSSSGTNIKRFLKIAAGLILLAGIAGTFTLILKNKGTPPAVIGLVRSGNDIFRNKPDSGNPERRKEVPAAENRSAVIDKKLVAENFTPSRFYDNLVENRLRYPGIEIVSPVKDTLPALPVIRWKGDDSRQLVIVLITNMEKEVLRKSISNGSVLQLTLRPGLYYWQLQNETETLFTGKFIYLPATDR